MQLFGFNYKDIIIRFALLRDSLGDPKISVNSQGVFSVINMNNNLNFMVFGFFTDATFRTLTLFLLSAVSKV